MSCAALCAALMSLKPTTKTMSAPSSAAPINAVAAESTCNRRGAIECAVDTFIRISFEQVMQRFADATNFGSHAIYPQSHDVGHFAFKRAELQMARTIPRLSDRFGFHRCFCSNGSSG